MKVSIEVGHKFCGQMMCCKICSYQWVTIRHRGDSPQNCHCPNCEHNGENVYALESPWTGIVEVEVDG